jgi:hypothetical protein
MEHKPTTMKSSRAILFVLACYSVVAQAQVSTRATHSQKDPREQCLMATGADWAGLGLDQDQILQVNSIQATCMKDCEAAREKESGITSVMDRHIAELRKVLTPQQYQQWDAWCTKEMRGSSDKEDTSKEGKGKP